MYVVDCSSRGDLTMERFVKVYDFRMMRAVSPLQVHIDPMFLRFVPTYSERICVVSQVRRIYCRTVQQVNTF